MRREHKLLNRLGVEARLLLLAAGPSTTDGEIAALLQARSVDWEALIALADRERATAVLWRRLRPHVGQTLPAEIRDRLERLAMVADFSASYLEARVGETLAHIESEGGRAIVLKGTALASSVYGSFFERPMGDVDLLVDAPDAERLWRSVQTIGWRWDQARYPASRYQGHHHLAPLDDARGIDVRLELHTSLFVDGSPFSLDSAALLRDGSRRAIGKGHAIVPSPEHLLLHSCVHFTWSHMMNFGSWRAFRDVSALANAEMDWPRLEEEAKRQHAESSCYWTLRLAERLVGAVLPQDTMARLRLSADESWLGVCERHVIGEIFRSENRCPSLWLRRLLWEKAIQPVRSGHGDARPWLLDDLAPENMDPAHTDGGFVRVARQLSLVGDWYRYVTGLLG